MYYNASQIRHLFAFWGICNDSHKCRSVRLLPPAHVVVATKARTSGGQCARLPYGDAVPSKKRTRAKARQDDFFSKDVVVTLPDGKRKRVTFFADRAEDLKVLERPDGPSRPGGDTET